MVGRHYSRDPSWSHVTRTPTGKRHDQISCNYCNAIWYSSDAKRVSKHLSKCTSAPPEVKQHFELLHPPRQANANHQTGILVPPQLVGSLPGGSQFVQQHQQQQQLQQQSGQSVAYQTSTLDPIGRPPHANQTELQNACARWIYKSGLPLTTTEHPAFKSLMHSLNPAFSAPTRRMLAESHALERAIDSASQPILANTLREICDRSDAAREIATAMLLPPHPPPATEATQAGPRGTTRRRAESSETIDRVCQHCDREFTVGAQLAKDCMYHPGELLIRPKRDTSVARHFG